jgi:hypothetical protein
MRIIIQCTAVCLLALICLTGCGGGDPEPEPQPTTMPVHCADNPIACK